jgi:hypothetical protein
MADRDSATPVKGNVWSLWLPHIVLMDLSAIDNAYAATLVKGKRVAIMGIDKGGFRHCNRVRKGQRREADIGGAVLM